MAESTPCPICDEPLDGTRVVVLDSMPLVAAHESCVKQKEAEAEARWWAEQGCTNKEVNDG